MSASNKYPGDLGSPLAPLPQKPFPNIDDGSTGYLAKLLRDPGSEEAKAEWDAWTSEYARRIGLLFDHFNIDATSPDAWMKLALNLADAHVLGLQPAKPRGKRGRKGFKDSLEAQLARDELAQLAAEYRKKHGLSWKRAFELLAQPSNRKKLPTYYQKKPSVSDSLLKADFQLARDELSEQVRRQVDLGQALRGISLFGPLPPSFPPGYVPSGGLLGRLPSQGERQADPDSKRPPDK